MTSTITHGTNTGYTTGCRCADCRGAHAEWHRNYRALHRRPRPSAIQRFRSRYIVGEPPEHAPEMGPCWLWAGALNRDGYGHIRIGDRKVPAHRFSYEYNVALIDAGLTIDHLCFVTSCVNFAHLEPVTSSENVRRANARRRAC